ncbi:MAG TPA: alpha/beta fold hydrolase [Gemmatimonadales bacterium]|nr:alpha/beta fold hydrolase [Gemmatimonadales bacterium]
MRLLRWMLAVTLLLGLVVLVAYQLKDPERHRLDDRARAGVPGRFVRLTDGVTHYETAGPDTGRAVVLAAGFSVPAYIWDSLFFRLADSGVRVVRFDYFGRGWSDRPHASYDQAFFVQQLDELLDSLHLTQPIDLAGLSFGGAIVTSFAIAHPERVHSLLYFDPAFNARRRLRPEERSRLSWSTYMIFRGGTDQMATGQLDDFLHPELHPDWVSRYRVQQQFEGTREALRQSRAAIEIDPDQTGQLRQLNAGALPILLVWGRQDSAIPFSGSAGVRQAMPRAVFVPVDSAGHLPHLEQPDTVIGTVMRFLRAGGSPATRP